jgi:hypothetical protein
MTAPDQLHPNNAQIIREEVAALEQKGRYSEATILREAYPEAFVTSITPAQEEIEWPE